MQYLSTLKTKGYKQIKIGIVVGRLMFQSIYDFILIQTFNP